MVGKKGKKELNGAGGLRRVGREGNGGVSPFHFFPYGGGDVPLRSSDRAYKKIPAIRFDRMTSEL